MRKIASKIINIFLIAIIIILLGFFGINLFNSLSGSDNTSAPRLLNVLTGSMSPVVKAGDMIVIKKVPFDSLKPKDIVTYRRGNILITHRVMSIDDKTVITRGDANNVDDEPIYKVDIVGKYLFKIPYGGYLSNALKRPYVLIPILSLLFIYIIYGYIEDKAKKLPKDS